MKMLQIRFRKQQMEHENDHFERPQDSPCLFPPGSPEKVETLRLRLESGMELWNPDDAKEAFRWSAATGLVSDSFLRDGRGALRRLQQLELENEKVECT
ncbi:hypothetical protein SH467x_003600 [Pirellulaceae bacterium SH467]